MTKKICKIVYCREGKERYELRLSLDGGNTWGLCVSCDFLECKDYPSHGSNYLHYSIIKELSNCILFGYQYIGIESEE